MDIPQSAQVQANSSLEGIPLQQREEDQPQARAESQSDNEADDNRDVPIGFPNMDFSFPDAGDGPEIVDLFSGGDSEPFLPLTRNESMHRASEQAPSMTPNDTNSNNGPTTTTTPTPTTSQGSGTQRFRLPNGAHIQILNNSTSENSREPRNQQRSVRAGTLPSNGNRNNSVVFSISTGPRNPNRSNSTQNRVRQIRPSQFIPSSRGARSNANLVPPFRPTPLASSVLPDQKQNYVDETALFPENETINVDDFKCNLCYEYMAQPYRHDTCSMVICEQCKRRIESAAGSQALKCPTCRNPCQFQVDQNLKGRITSAPPIRCRFVGCDAKALSLSDVAKHESSCPFVRVSCRFSKWGCLFAGPRGDLAKHEENDCSLAKMEVLIKQHMRLMANFQHFSMHLQQRNEGNAQMIHLLQHQIQMVANDVPTMVREALAISNSDITPSNPLHVLEFIVALFAGVSEGAKWRRMKSQEGIASIANQLMFLPAMLLSVSFCFHNVSMITRSIQADSKIIDFLEIGVVCVAAFFALVVVLLSVCLDQESSCQWKSFSMSVRGRNLGEHTIGGSLATIGSVLLFGLLFLDAQISVGWGYACFKFLWATLATLLFPIVTVVLVKRDSQSTPTLNASWKDIVFQGRAAKPILCGLWVGFAWGSTDSLGPELLVLLSVFYFFLTQSNIPRRMTLPIIGLATALFAVLVKYTEDALDPTALLLFVLSNTATLVFQRFLAVAITYFAKSNLCPPRQIMLFTCLFVWTILLAL